MARCNVMWDEKEEAFVFNVADSDDDAVADQYFPSEKDQLYNNLLDFAKANSKNNESEDTDSDESSDSDSMQIDENVTSPEVSQECLPENAESSTQNIEHLTEKVPPADVNMAETPMLQGVPVLNIGDIYIIEEIQPPFMPVIVKTEGSYRGPLSSPVEERPAAGLPPSHGWDGNHHFRIKINYDGTGKRSDPAVYHEAHNKLYVRRDYAFKVLFYAENVPPGAIIRATAVFSLADHAFDIVNRCPIHMQQDFTKGSPLYEHFIQCLNEGAAYEKNAMTGRCSVMVPYEKPQEGEDYISYFYKFTCFSSCPGGINRRPFMLLITLENEDIHLGRQSVEVKVSANPLRDLRTDIEKDMKNNPDAVIPDPPAVSCADENVNTCSSGSQAAARPQSTIYSLAVEDPRMYRFLLEMKNLFESSS